MKNKKINFDFNPRTFWNPLTPILIEFFFLRWCGLRYYRAFLELYTDNKIWMTYVCFDEIISMWHEIIVVFHISSFLDANVMLHRIQTFA